MYKIFVFKDDFQLSYLNLVLGLDNESMDSFSLGQEGSTVVEDDGMAPSRQKPGMKKSKPKRKVIYAYIRNKL